jgi:hypothetical protein
MLKRTHYPLSPSQELHDRYAIHDLRSCRGPVLFKQLPPSFTLRVRGVEHFHPGDAFGSVRRQPVPLIRVTNAVVRS